MTDRQGIRVNGVVHEVEAAPDAPLPYVLRNELGLNSPQFGCGLEQCCACIVLLGARAVQSCKLTLASRALHLVSGACHLYGFTVYGLL